jgi:hypothetical protein
MIIPLPSIASRGWDVQKIAKSGAIEVELGSCFKEWMKARLDLSFLTIMQRDKTGFCTIFRRWVNSSNS